MNNQDMESKKDKAVDEVWSALLGEGDPTQEQIDAAKVVKKTTETISMADALARLGITQEDLETLRKKKTRGSRGGYFTTKDADVIHFLALAKYCTDGIIAIGQGVAVSSTQKHLKRLIGKKLVRRVSVPGMKSLYTLTAHGMTVSGYDGKVVTDSNMNVDSIQPTLGAAWALAMYWDQHKDFVAEWQIRSDLGRQNNRTAGAFREIAGAAKVLWGKWVNAKKDPETSPELTNPFLYGLPNDNVKSRAPQYHCPDLVVVMPRGEDGKPRSIAIEIERSLKSVDAYKRTMLAYEEDKNVFGKVIWFAATDGIAKRIEEGCKQTLIPKSRYVITFIHTKDENGERVRYRGGDFTKM